MAISTMYPAKPGSPKTTLTADITASATSMTLADASVLPAAPNICVLGEDESAEIVSYTTISSNTVSGLVRGLGGTTASGWPTDTVVARNFTSFDHDRFMDNITTLSNEKANLASPTLTGTPKAPTASSGTNTTQIATTAFVQSTLSGKADAVHTHSAGDITSGILGTVNGGTGNNTGTAPYASTAADTSNALYPVGVTSGATTTLKRDTSVTISGGTVTATTFSGALSGNASTATSLATSRTIQTNLGSTSAASFNGTSNVTPGVTGTLKIANGGTEASTRTGSSGAAAKIFADNVGTNASHFMTISSSWGSVGYSSVDNVKSMIGLGDSGEQTATNSENVASGTIKYRKIGKTVWVWGTAKLASPLSGTAGVLLTTLPSGYRPADAFFNFAGNPNVASGPGAVQFGTNGNVRFYRPGDKTWSINDNIYFSATFFTS